MRRQNAALWIDEVSISECREQAGWEQRTFAVQSDLRHVRCMGMAAAVWAYLVGPGYTGEHSNIQGTVRTAHSQIMITPELLYASLAGMCCR